MQWGHLGARLIQFHLKASQEASGPVSNADKLLHADDTPADAGDELLAAARD